MWAMEGDHRNTIAIGAVLAVLVSLFTFFGYASVRVQRAWEMEDRCMDVCAEHDAWGQYQTNGNRCACTIPEGL